ncbi:hypothetical protein C4D60_Mb01t10370 [Musa balbisiana]|uniref:UV radiation resistance protein/autophagy-related protein 14 n=1 Tax=Musa balbisiana TaxID=52838 RepID=A0A4S8JL76_MUSBA|nr:hypothetical protein C4D60_Mb01t10370 [Musa balbisiana]
MARKPSSSSCCTICEGSNLSSICASCVNYRLNEYSVLLRSLTNIRESLYSRLNDELAEKRKATHQSNWRVTQNEKIRKLKEHLTCSKRQLVEVNAKVVEASNNLKLRFDSLDSAFATIKNHMGSLDKLNSDLIYSQCLAYMAITSERLHKQSMVIRQICRLFPMRRKPEYWDDRKKVNLDGANDGSNGPYDQICNARLPRGLDPHSVPSEELAASLGYMVQLLNLVVPNLAAPLLHNSGFAGSCSLIWQRDSYWDARPTSQRPAKQAQQLNRSVWDENSGVPSSSFMGSMQTTVSPNSDASFDYSAEVTASVNSESLVEGWDIVEHP